VSSFLQIIRHYTDVDVVLQTSVFVSSLVQKRVNNTRRIQLLTTMVFYRKDRQITETLLRHGTAKEVFDQFQFENERSQVATVTGNVSKSM